MARDIEGPIHRSILAYIRLALPNALIHHSPNAIGLSGAQIMRQLAHDRDMGTVKGFPDLIVLPWDRIGPMFFEVKAGRNKPDATQEALHERLRALGYKVAVVRSIDDTAAALAEWGVWASVDAKQFKGAAK